MKREKIICKKAKVSKRKKSLVTRLKSEIGKNMSNLTKVCYTENYTVGHHISTYHFSYSSEQFSNKILILSFKTNTNAITCKIYSLETFESKVSTVCQIIPVLLNCRIQMIDGGWFIRSIYLDFLLMMANQFMSYIEEQTENICQTTLQSTFITIGKYFG